jgi:hypothetical protein
MRLAQLARKLALKPSDIVAFLAEKGVAIENNSNTKLSDEHVDKVMAHFVGPGPSSENQPPVDAPPQVQDEIIEVNPREKLKVEEALKTTHDEENTTEENKIEVIKAPKVDLPGLKVVGKIELPEKKKKEETQAEEGAESDTQEKSIPQSKPRKSPARHQSEHARPRKNPIALAREREERDALRKKQEEAKREKELRTQRYYNKLQSAKSTKQARKQRERVDEYETYKDQDHLPEPPKTVLGKIWRWLKPPNNYQGGSKFKD